MEIFRIVITTRKRFLEALALTGKSIIDNVAPRAYHEGFSMGMKSGFKMGQVDVNNQHYASSSSLTLPWFDSRQLPLILKEAEAILWEDEDEKGEL